MRKTWFVGWHQIGVLSFKFGGRTDGSLSQYMAEIRGWLIAWFWILFVFAIVAGMHGSHWMAWGTVTSFGIHGNQIKMTSLEGKNNTLLPFISPNQAPQPFIPLGAPPPLAPFTNDSVPKLSGYDFKHDNQLCHMVINYLKYAFFWLLPWMTHHFPFCRSLHI